MKKTIRIASAAGAPPNIAHLLLKNLSVAQMRALSPLPEDAQKVIDQAVVRVGMDRLTVVQDLLAENLTFPLADALSTLEVQWDSISRAGSAQRTMNPAARGENQLADRTPNRIPVYLTTDDFFLGVRTLRASQRVGAPLDVTGVENATRNVNEAIEDAAINGASLSVAGYDTPGILNAPNVNTFTYGANLAWDAPSKTGQNILDDVLGMVDMAQTAKRYGPFNLYLPTTYGNKLNQDFKANGDKTILQRLQELQYGGRELRIRTADMMPTNRTALVQMTRDVVDVITGQSPVTVPYTSIDGFTLFWMVMAIIVPRVKSDFDEKSGIVTGNV